MAQTIKLAIPAYFLPGALWAEALSYTSGKVKFMVANVNSGPENGKNPNQGTNGDGVEATYTVQIAAAQAAGIKVIGYVASRYSNDRIALSTVKFKIKRWYDLYPTIDGIFIDDVYSDQRDLQHQYEYYRNVSDYIKIHTKQFIVFNPGTTPLIRYIDRPGGVRMCDVICSFEDTYENYLSFEIPPWTVNGDFNPNRFWHIVHTCPNSVAMTAAFNKAKNTGAKGVGHIYITQKAEPNPFDVLPTFPFSDEMALIQIPEIIVPPVPPQYEYPPFSVNTAPNIITREQAQASMGKIWKESFSLNPATLINLYIIDVTEVLSDNNLQNIFPRGKFYFHNNVKFLDTALYWDEDKTGQVEKFIAAPIIMDGFETSSKGVLPTPRMSITVSESGIDTLALLKQEIWTIGDLVGAKVTRIRTFAKFLPEENKLDLVMSDAWEPDKYAEFPRDVYFVERLENMDKLNITYSLASILDVEGILIPFRRVLANNCSHSYRGEGCLYEDAERRFEPIHGKASTYSSAEPYPVSILPISARAVANDKDELIFGGDTSILKIQPGPYFGAWDETKEYPVGEQVHVQKSGIKYRFVCKVVNRGIPPPDVAYWIADLCSHRVSGCKIRWGVAGVADVGPYGPDGVSSTGLKLGRLPYGGFPSVSRLNNR